jgi:hypothetical protein
MPELNVAVQGLFQLPLRMNLSVASVPLLGRYDSGLYNPAIFLDMDYRTFQSVNRFDASN